MRSVTFFAPQLNHATETMAYFVALGGGCRVFLATSLNGSEESEHPWVLQRVREFRDIEIVPYDGAPRHTDILVFFLVRHGQIPREFLHWRACAKTAAYLTPTEGRTHWKDWLRQVVRSFPHYLRANRIHFFPYLHPQIIVNSDWLASSFAEIDPEARRRWRVGFLGNRQPPERMARLAQIKDVIPITDQRVRWHEYGGMESTGPRGLDAMEYMRTLSEIDFCISPPGWGLQWTHRTIEALVRGSIPIVEDPLAYGLGLRDAETCIVTKPDQWGAAVRRVLEISEKDVRRMRRNIIALRDAQLVPDRAIERFRSQLLD